MNKKLMLTVALLLSSCQQAYALTYYVYDNEGNKWYMNRPNEKTGVYPDSLGTVSKSKPHPNGIALRLETDIEKAKCISTALAVCDPENKGIKLYVNGEPPIRCDMLTAKSMQTENGTYAISLVPYDGFKMNGVGVKYCPF